MTIRNVSVIKTRYLSKYKIKNYAGELMVQAQGIKEVAYVDCKGGGQIEVVNGTAYVGHTAGPEATTIIDVKDPKNPKIVHQLMCAHENVHAHKVRVANDLMITNYESIDYMGEPGPGFRGGLNIYDVSNPHEPKHIHFWETAGEGVHRYTFDGRYAYISPTVEGYIGHICMIMDLADPTNPQEVGRWHWPGQWEAGGEVPDIPREHLRCHHGIRQGDFLYVSYWHAGWAILDISDMTNPVCVSRQEWKPPYAHPAHTALPIPFKLKGMDVMLLADEDVAKKEHAGPAFIWLYDIGDKANPRAFASFQLDHLDSGIPAPNMTGCHQPVEVVRSTEIPVAWFEQGLRIMDIANPHAPKEVAHYVPDAPKGAERPLSNDVFQDDDGLIYLIDRDWGLHILERS